MPDGIFAALASYYENVVFTDALRIRGVRLAISASVAQWIEHQIPVLRVGGSSPSGRAKERCRAVYST